MAKNLIIVILSCVIVYQFLFVNASSARPIVFNTQPLNMGWKLFRAPWLEITDDAVIEHKHGGWAIRCLSINEQAGTIEPNYEKECTKPQ
jgi:hypothetical protein